MLVQDVIKKNRASFEKLKQQHLDWERTHGASGFPCIDFQEFLDNYYNLTDKQIIEKVLERGIEIEDAEEFLTQEEEKKEKTD